MDRRSAISRGLLLLQLIVSSQGLAVSTPQCSGGPPDRGERLFFLAPRIPPQRSHVPTVTSTYTSTRVISEVWLSSCVTYATSLPNCPREARGDLGRSPIESRLDPRDLGKMELSPSKVQPILSTDAPHLPKEGENERKLRTFSKPFWEDLMGLAFPLPSDRPTPPLHSVPSTGHRENTVTRTVTVTATKRVKGPKTVVSFSITGCMPSKLPFDVERCEEPKVISLRIPADVPTEEPPLEAEESSTVPSTGETEAPKEEAVTNDPPPSVEGNAWATPTEDTPPESEQMIPAPNESVTIPGTPEEHEELGSGFSK